MALSLQDRVFQFVKTRKEAVTLIGKECAAQGLTLTADEISTVASELATEQVKELSAKPAKTAINNFTKYQGELAPQTYLSIFDDECQLFGITDDADRLRIFPSLMEGPKAQHAQTELRTQTAWIDAKNSFIKLFEVDRASALADLQFLQVRDFDVDGYVASFNQLMARYPWNSGDEDALKDAFVRNLPYKTKEKMLVDRDFSSLTLAALQNESKRTHKAINQLNSINRNNNQGNQNKSKADGDWKNNNRNWENRQDQFIAIPQKFISKKPSVIRLYSYSFSKITFVYNFYQVVNYFQIKILVFDTTLVSTIQVPIFFSA